MASQPGKQVIAMHILPNISKSNENQTMKFRQLIKYSMRKSFLKNDTRNVIEKHFPRPFSKKLKL